MADDPRRPGRPPLDPSDPSVGVYVRMPSREYDRLSQRASQAGVTVPELLRRGAPPDVTGK